MGGEVPALGKRTVPSDLVCLSQVVGRDDVRELVPRVLEHDATPAIASARPQPGSGHVGGDGLADRVVTRGDRQGRVVVGEPARRGDIRAVRR